MSGLIPVNGQVVVQVTPPAGPVVTLNEITVGGINQPAVAYHHTQGTASAVWNITHYLGWYPNVTVQDSGGSIVEGEISYTSSNALTVTFSGAFRGDAYLS
jgi:hypothetical protein